MIPWYWLLIEGYLAIGLACAVRVGNNSTTDKSDRSLALVWIPGWPILTLYWLVGLFED